MNAAGRSLVIRVDAAADIGFGHVMRCIALGQAWRDGNGTVAVWARPLPGPILQRLDAEGFDVKLLSGPFDPQQDALFFVQQLVDDPPAAVVADGYHFSTEWQAIVRRAGIRLLVIDDHAHLDRYVADIVLNQNPQAGAHLYREKNFSGRLLAGCQYALLRQEFLNRRGRTSADPKPDARCQLLVTLGGYDPGGVTQRVVEALELLAPDRVIATIVSPIAGIEVSRPEITLVPFASDMAELMARCDLAICAGGSTNWEMSLFGLPRLVLVLADNQQRIAGELHRIGCCRNLGWYTELTAPQIARAIQELIDDEPGRQLMATANRGLVDGGGARRVCEVLAGP